MSFFLFKDMHFFFFDFFPVFFFLKHNIPLTGLSIHCRSTNVRGQPIANLSIFSAHVNVGRVWLVLVGFFWERSVAKVVATALAALWGVVRSVAVVLF